MYPNLRPMHWILSVAQVPVQQKLLKKNVQMEPGRKRLEQVLSNVQVLCFIKQKILGQAIAHQNNHAQPKGGGKIMPQKITETLTPISWLLVV